MPVYSDNILRLCLDGHLLLYSSVWLTWSRVHNMRTSKRDRADLPLLNRVALGGTPVHGTMAAGDWHLQSQWVSTPPYSCSMSAAVRAGYSSDASNSSLRFRAHASQQPGACGRAVSHCASLTTNKSSAGMSIHQGSHGPHSAGPQAGT